MSEFAQNMRRKADGIRSNATILQRKTAGAILQAVVMGTPVGNPLLWMKKAPPGYVGGRARGNWIVGIGSAGAGNTNPPDSHGSTTLQHGAAEIERSTPGISIHLTNNVPYIIPLNEGHSRQAPAGFIEAAVLAGRDAAANSQKIVPS